MSIRILLADDHKIMREGLRKLLEQEPGFEVVGEAGTGRAAVQLARELRPDLVVMDLSMPDMNGVDATRHIIEAVSEVKVIGLSIHAHRRFVAEMFRAGASGYLLKDCDSKELATAIRTVMGDQVYLSPSIAGELIDDYLHKLADGGGSAFTALTDRERQVLQLLAEGQTTREVAQHLHVSVKTVETHRMRIMNKLGIHTIAELTKYAIREGLTALEL